MPGWLFGMLSSTGSGCCWAGFGWRFPALMRLCSGAVLCVPQLLFARSTASLGTVPCQLISICRLMQGTGGCDWGLSASGGWVVRVGLTSAAEISCRLLRHGPGPGTDLGA